LKYETGGGLNLSPVMRESISAASGGEPVFTNRSSIKTRSPPLAAL
jgi:hypothetical protein